MRHLSKLACLIALLAGTAVRAQTSPPGAEDMMHAAAANQLGILEYCQAQHFIGAEIVARERGQIAAMPPSRSASALEVARAAEAAGRQGVVQAGDQRVSLADAARMRGGSVAALCDQIASALPAPPEP